MKFAGEPLVDTNVVNAFAKSWCEEHRGKWVEAERLGGFCLLINERAGMEQVNYLLAICRRNPQTVL